MRYTSSLLKTTNTTTGNVRYYVSICDVMQRISKAEYDARRDGCDGVCNLYDETKKNHRRQYTTIVMYN